MLLGTMAVLLTACSGSSNSNEQSQTPNNVVVDNTIDNQNDDISNTEEDFPVSASIRTVRQTSDGARSVEVNGDFSYGGSFSDISIKLQIREQQSGFYWDGINTYRNQEASHTVSFTSDGTWEYSFDAAAGYNEYYLVLIIEKNGIDELGDEDFFYSDSSNGEYIFGNVNVRFPIDWNVSRDVLDFSNARPVIGVIGGDGNFNCHFTLYSYGLDELQALFERQIRDRSIYTDGVFGEVRSVDYGNTSGFEYTMNRPSGFGFLRYHAKPTPDKIIVAICTSNEFNFDDTTSRRILRTLTVR